MLDFILISGLFDPLPVARIYYVTGAYKDY